MPGFPLLWDGALLFCRGGLATECCVSGGGYDGWESHGEWDFPPELDCDAPVDWDGKWDISTPCPGGNCSNPRTEITVDMSDGNTCSFADAVATDALCGKVEITFIPPISGKGTWTIWAAGESFSMGVDCVEAQAAHYEMYMPDTIKEVLFQTTGTCDIKSRIIIAGDNGEELARESVKYIYVFKWDDYGSRDPGCVVHPSSNVVYLLDDGHGKYPNNITRLRTFDTYNEAVTVADAYEQVILAYVESCACRCPQGSDYGNLAREDTSGPSYVGVIEGSEGEHCAPSYIHAGVNGRLVWTLETSGNGFSIYLQRKAYGAATWESVVGANAGSGEEFDGTANPCDEFRVWGVFESGCAGDFSINWEFTPSRDYSPSCPEEVQEAFEGVPGT